MKKQARLYLLLATLLAAAPAFGQLAPVLPAAKPQQFVIVNGKKFFLMQNAKHYTSSGAPSPQALGVMNHPLQPGVIAHRTAMPLPAYNEATDTKSSTSNNSVSSTPVSNPVLSVFAPNESR